MKKMVTFLCISLVILLIIPLNTSIVHRKDEMIEIVQYESKKQCLSNETEYWALLVAVGVYANNPDMDRPSMLVEVERFKKTLSVSPHWKEDHIKVIKGENATVPNILRGFKWLDEMEDENDICLIYLTTHGFPILFDLPPFDEEDGMDEALATYKGFLPIENPWSWEPLANPFAIITDDEFNFLFNRLESKGIGIIVDSCHSGGFNDNWSYSKITNWANEFAGEMKGQNRVIVTSVPEEDVSYGSFFTHYLIKGLQGYGDANNDGICSLEEAFYYAKPIIEKETRMSPQIFDSYPGELLLTEVEFPPSTPEKLQGEIIGKTNKTYVYTTSSEDPEGDEIKYLINWGDGNEEWTDFYLSGEIATLSHLWNKEGTYNVIVKAVDKWGAESEWSERLVVTMAGKHVVDQRQTTQKWAFLVNNTRWCAQSFVPTIDKISKIELEVIAWKPNYTFILSIKESLDGLDMVEATAIPRVSKYWESQWLDFNFPSISVTPGKTYYIVCKSPQEGWGVAWMTGINNPYSNGNFYTSSDAGENWKKETRWSSDACFVTYG